MALDTTLNAGTGGDIIATTDLTNFASFGYPSSTTTPNPVKLPLCALYVSQAIGTTPTPVTTANSLPVNLQGAIPAGANAIGTVTLGAGTAAVGTVTTNADAPIAAGTAPSKAFVGGGVYNTTAPALTNTQSIALQVDAAGNLCVSGEGHKNTYSASSTFTPAASATDIAILPGSATKTIKVLRVKVQLSSSAAAVQDIIVDLIKRSTANSGGTSTALTVVPHDSNDAAGSAVPLFYTANPTVGTSVGNVDSAVVPTVVAASATATPSPLNEWVMDYTAPGMQPVVLRGVAQGLAVNLGGVSVTATATAKVTYTYTEE